MIDKRNEHISELRKKLEQTNAIIAKNNNQITNIRSRLSKYKPQTHKLYRQSVKFTKSLINFANANNSLIARSTSYRYAIKMAELSIKNKYFNELTAPQLNEYIKYVEESQKFETWPFTTSTVKRINVATRKLHSLILKSDYISNICLPKSNEYKKIYYNTILKKIKKDIDYYTDYIKDLKSSFLNKHVAKLVTKLEKLAKETSATSKANDKYLINFNKVIKYYNNGAIALKVLQDVNLKIQYGEFVVILGPSGSGKTTLLNIISGMDKATYGDTIVGKHNLITMNSTQLTKFRRDNIGYIFQQYGLLPNLTVKENVEVGSNLQKDAKKHVNVDELLKTIGIYEQRNKYPHELSGGQQQRVSIARSVAKNPLLIFGDEPTGAIDEGMSKQIMQLFVDINKQYKTTIVIVTHNPILADLGTMVIKVVDGKINKIIQNAHPKKVSDLHWGKI